MPPVAILENLGFRFPADSQPALQEINWTIEEGRHCALIGPNGSGKSTLLGIMAGNLWPGSGSICWIGPRGPETSPIYGRSVTALVSPALQENTQRMGFSVTFLDALLGAFDQSPLSFANPDPDAEKLEKARAAAESLNCVNLLTMPLSSLSQGQMRILFCARAILRRPKLCLLDEALDGLDKEHRILFYAALSKLAPQSTIILSSHRNDGIPAFCEERRYLFGGRLFEKPGNIFFRAAPKSGKAGKTAGKTLFKLENVDVFINRQQVLHNIDWQSRQGEHWRISGPNGSGKSTLLRLLAGEEVAASGGTVSCWLPHLGRSARGLGELRQGARLVSDLTQALYAYDLTGLELVCSGFGQTIGIYREYSDEERENAMQAISRFFPDGTGERIARASIRRLSSGQLRRLHLARALMGKPSILLLDEPCTGLDAQSRAEFFVFLENLSRTMQIIMVSHYDEDCPEFINREAAMRDGRLATIR